MSLSHYEPARERFNAPTDTSKNRPLRCGTSLSPHTGDASATVTPWLHGDGPASRFVRDSCCEIAQSQVIPAVSPVPVRVRDVL